MKNIENYTIQLAAIIDSSKLKIVDPLLDNIDYLVNVLAKHPATNRLEILVLAKNQNGINKFHDDFPDAAVVIGDGTPDNHNEWIMLAFPKEINASTSPVEIYNRGKQRAKAIHGQGNNNG